MKGFSGFPIGKMKSTAVPNQFFSDLLPEIDHIGELKVTLYAFWALTQQDRSVRYLRITDFLHDPLFMQGMGERSTDSAENLIDSVERAVARGTFLHVSVETADGVIDLYFMNTGKGRAAVEGIEAGSWRPALGREEKQLSLLIERPNIFTLYEQNIGTLTPMIVEELKDAEKMYPSSWVEEAIQIGVRNNRRSWRYIGTILENWRQQGKDSGFSRRNHQTLTKQQQTDHRNDLFER